MVSATQSVSAGGSSLPMQNDVSAGGRSVSAKNTVSSGSWSGNVFTLDKEVEYTDPVLAHTNDSSGRNQGGDLFASDLGQGETHMPANVLEIFNKLDEDTKSFAMEYISQLAQKSEAELRKLRNDAYLAKLQRAYDQIANGDGVVRDVIEVLDDE